MTLKLREMSLGAIEPEIGRAWTGGYHFYPPKSPGDD